MISPILDLRSSRSSARHRIAIISLATVISNEESLSSLSLIHI